MVRISGPVTILGLSDRSEPWPLETLYPVQQLHVGIHLVCGAKKQLVILEHLQLVDPVRVCPDPLLFHVRLFLRRIQIELLKKRKSNYVIFPLSFSPFLITVEPVYRVHICPGGNLPYIRPSPIIKNTISTINNTE